MTIVSLNRGRMAEQAVARRLTEWAQERYIFRRRGLGHAGLPDLVVTAFRAPTVAPWPYPVSVKSSASKAPGLHGLVRLAGALARVPALAGPGGWRWWREIPPAELTRYWLIWRAHRTWWLSADGDNPVWRAGAWPALLRLAGPGTRVPSYTAPLDDLLGLDVAAVVQAAL